MARTVTVTRKSKWLSVTVLALVVSICSTIQAQATNAQTGESGDVGIQAQEPPAPPGPSLISYVKLPPALEFCGEPVPLDILDVRERLEKEIILALQDQGQVILWLKRTTRYLPEVEAVLRESGLPPDLKYVPVVESALRPHAGSRKNAIGFWQFMEGTGKRQGLVINDRLDERRSLLASTRGAVRYLQSLYGIFSSWTLAVAAYNMGEDGLMAAILEQGVDNYYQLYLPLETQAFVFKILTVKLILSDPARYGFQLAPEDYYPPLLTDRVEVQCSRDTPIRIVAQAAKTYFKVIKDLNPEIRGSWLPVGTHTLLVPLGAAGEFQKRFSALVDEWLTARDKQIYVVKEGDTLTSIAARFKVPLGALLEWNRLKPKATIRPGDKVIVGKAAKEEAEVE
ncbi:MAG: lytic transglycosylase, lysM domain [Deltaproteobacteria bacterium]|nr:lytic transglycosylase, lysM domain [Deltaproteobacteria bacterium]